MATVSIPSKAYMSSCLRSLPVTSCWCGCRVDGRTGADHEGEVVVEVEVEVVVDQSASTRSLLTRSQHVSQAPSVLCARQSTVLFPRVPVSVFFVSLCELSCAIARARAPLLLGDMAGAGKTPEEEAYERKQEYKAYLHKHGMNTYGFCLEWWWWCL